MPSSKDMHARNRPAAAPRENALVKQYAKAVTALLTPLVCLAATKFGLGLSDAECGSIAAVVTGGLVAIVPNSYGKA